MAKQSVDKFSTSWLHLDTFNTACNDKQIKRPQDLPKEETSYSPRALFDFSKKLPALAKEFQFDSEDFNFLPNPELYPETVAWFREGLNKHKTKFTRTLLFALCNHDRSALVSDILG